MQIEDAGEIKSFETVPQDSLFFLSVVRYGANYWTAGPAGRNKDEVISMLQGYSGIDAARLYWVRLPLLPLPPV